MVRLLFHAHHSTLTIDESEQFELARGFDTVK
jgi:hypothetical protein